MAKGVKTGGRKKGTPNKATEKRREIAEAELDKGITPLEVLLQTMREEWEQGNKAAACLIAKDAAPYIHPRLAAHQVTGEITNYVMRMPEPALSVEQWAQETTIQ
jgi:hypothetical protein